MESRVNNMGRLSAITEEMASRLLSDVEYGSHLTGTKVHPMAGNSTFVLMNLQEAKDFLHIGSLESLVVLGGGGTVHYLDWVKLKNWVAEVMCDQELANAISEEIDKNKCYAETMGPIRELLEERLAQCQALLKIDENQLVPST
jgi:hypothetical protein